MMMQVWISWISVAMAAMGCSITMPLAVIKRAHLPVFDDTVVATSVPIAEPMGAIVK
jgi:hypothetical protein